MPAIAAVWQQSEEPTDVPLAHAAWPDDQTLAFG